MLEVCSIKFSLSDCNFSLTVLKRDVLLSLMPSLNPVEFLNQANSNGTFTQARINQPNRKA